MIEVRRLTGFPDELLGTAAALYAEAGWVASGESCAFLRPALLGSCVVVGAFEGERLIGLGRALSDGVSDAYIQDVVVSPDFRRRGVGGEIVRRLVSELRDRGVDWIALVGEPGTEKFYAELGFEKKADHTMWQSSR